MRYFHRPLIVWLRRRIHCWRKILKLRFKSIIRRKVGCFHRRMLIIRCLRKSWGLRLKGGIRISSGWRKIWNCYIQGYQCRLLPKRGSLGDMMISISGKELWSLKCSSINSWKYLNSKLNSSFKVGLKSQIEGNSKSSKPVSRALQFPTTSKT